MTDDYGWTIIRPTVMGVSPDLASLALAIGGWPDKLAGFFGRY